MKSNLPAFWQEQKCFFVKCVSGMFFRVIDGFRRVRQKYYISRIKKRVAPRGNSTARAARFPHI